MGRDLAEDRVLGLTLDPRCRRPYQRNLSKDTILSIEGLRLIIERGVTVKPEDSEGLKSWRALQYTPPPPPALVLFDGDPLIIFSTRVGKKVYCFNSGSGIETRYFSDLIE